MSKKGEAALGALRNFYPDGAVRLAEKVKGLNAERKTIEVWREEQLVKFIAALKVNAEELERAFAEKKAPTAAWVTRNILELDVWIDYCNLSDLHAKRFKDDSMRDIMGFVGAIRAMAKEAQGQEVPELKRAQGMIEEAMQKGFGITDDKYLRADLAAEELGRKGQFSNLNRMLSKFAHPTAWLVDFGESMVDSEEACEGFLVMAVMIACGALTKIHEHVIWRFPIPMAKAAP